MILVAEYMDFATPKLKVFPLHYDFFFLLTTAKNNQHQNRTATIRMSLAQFCTSLLYTQWRQVTNHNKRKKKPRDLIKCRGYICRVHFNLIVSTIPQICPWHLGRSIWKLSEEEKFVWVSTRTHFKGRRFSLDYQLCFFSQQKSLFLLL